MVCAGPLTVKNAGSHACSGLLTQLDLSVFPVDCSCSHLPVLEHNLQDKISFFPNQNQYSRVGYSSAS